MLISSRALILSFTCVAVLLLHLGEALQDYDSSHDNDSYEKNLNHRRDQMFGMFGNDQNCNEILQGVFFGAANAASGGLEGEGGEGDAFGATMQAPGALSDTFFEQFECNCYPNIFQFSMNIDCRSQEYCFANETSGVASMAGMPIADLPLAASGIPAMNGLTTNYSSTTPLTGTPLSGTPLDVMPEGTIPPGIEDIAATWGCSVFDFNTRILTIPTPGIVVEVCINMFENQAQLCGSLTFCADTVVAGDVCGCSISADGTPCNSCQLCGDILGEGGPSVEVNCDNIISGANTNGCLDFQDPDSFADLLSAITGIGEDAQDSIAGLTGAGFDDDGADDIKIDYSPVPVLLPDTYCSILERQLSTQSSGATFNCVCGGDLLSLNADVSCSASAACIDGKGVYASAVTTTGAVPLVEPAFKCGQTNVNIMRDYGRSVGDQEISTMSSCFRNSTTDICVEATLCSTNITNQTFCGCNVIADGQECSECAICGEDNDGFKIDCSNVANIPSTILNPDTCVASGVASVPHVLAGRQDLNGNLLVVLSDDNVTDEDDIDEDVIFCSHLDRIFRGQTKRARESLYVTTTESSYDCNCNGNVSSLNASIECTEIACIYDNNSFSETCGLHSIEAEMFENAESSSSSEAAATTYTSCFHFDDMNTRELNICIEAQLCSPFDLYSHEFCSCIATINGRQCNTCDICKSENSSDEVGFDIDCAEVAFHTAVDVVSGRVSRASNVAATARTHPTTKGCFTGGISNVPLVLAGAKPQVVNASRNNSTIPTSLNPFINIGIEDGDQESITLENAQADNDGEESGCGNLPPGFCKTLHDHYTGTKELHAVVNTTSYNCKYGGSEVSLDAYMDCETDVCLDIQKDSVCGASIVDLSMDGTLIPFTVASTVSSCFDMYSENNKSSEVQSMCVHANLCSVLEPLSKDFCTCTATMYGSQCRSCRPCGLVNDSIDVQNIEYTGFDIDCSNVDPSATTNGCFIGGIAFAPFLLAGVEGLQDFVAAPTPPQETEISTGDLCAELETQLDEEGVLGETSDDYNCTCSGTLLTLDAKVACSADGCVGDGERCGEYNVGLDIRPGFPPKSFMYSCFDSDDGEYQYCIEANMCSIFEFGPGREGLCDCDVRVNGWKCRSCTICEENGFDIDCTNTDVNASTNGCFKDGISAIPFLTAGEIIEWEYITDDGSEDYFNDDVVDVVDDVVVVDDCLFPANLSNAMCASYEEQFEDQVGAFLTCDCADGSCSEFVANCVTNFEICPDNTTNCGMMNLNFTRGRLARTFCSSFNSSFNSSDQNDEYCISVSECPASGATALNQSHSENHGLCCTASGHDTPCNSCEVCGSGDSLGYDINCTNINAGVTTNGCMQMEHVVAEGIVDNAPLPILITLVAHDLGNETNLTSSSFSMNHNQNMPLCFLLHMLLIILLVSFQILLLP